MDSELLHHLIELITMSYSKQLKNKTSKMSLKLQIIRTCFCRLEISGPPGSCQILHLYKNTKIETNIKGNKFAEIEKQKQS